MVSTIITTSVNRSSGSFDDTRRINNTLYPTFQAAAMAAHLVTDLTASLARECFPKRFVPLL